jgi:adenylate cyclase, class 2
MQHLEIEVKFYLKNRTKLRQDLQRIDAKCDGRVFERNLRFEDAAHNLRKKGCLLRLRQDKGNILTFKRPFKGPDQGCKVFEEIETKVSDLEATSAILTALGYQCVQIYEKWRETFQVGDTVVCIDTMPFGDFIEIEGLAADIKKLARQLGFKWEKRILATYLGLFEALAKAHNLSFVDITFDNFKPVTNIFDNFWSGFEAGEVV